MGAVRRLILENSLGQRIRAYRAEDGLTYLVYRHDLRRVQLEAGLAALDAQDIAYDVIHTVDAAHLGNKVLNIPGGGALRLAKENESLDLSDYSLENDKSEDKIKSVMVSSAIGHMFMVGALLTLAFILAKLAPEKTEPTLVTIQIPQQKEERQQQRQHVQVAQTKIKPTPVQNRKVVSRPVHKVKPVVAQKTVVKPSPRKQAPIVRNAPQRNMERVGALAALGGIQNGKRGAEGLDANSLKQIRSAGIGNGGGGVGAAGSGGVSGMMAGSGLIAGSAGSGARAQSAGGYGTRGTGGGQAGYGKISLVGGTSAVSLPSDEEPTVEGGLDKDQIAAVINRHKGEIIYCYEQGLQNRADLRGRVSISFVIGPNGRVSVANVAQTSLNAAQVENCMVARLKSWPFPRPVGNVSVDVLYPFELRRVSSR